MPIFYCIDPAAKLIRARMRGVMSVEEVDAGNQRFLSDPAYRPEYDTLTDMREMLNVVPTDFVKRIASQKEAIRSSLAGTRHAIVVAGEAAYGLMRMFQGITGGDESPFRVFRTMEEAYIWLGLTDEKPTAQH